MRDLAALTAADFEAAVGGAFEIAGAQSEPVSIRLTEVVRFGARPGHRQPFSTTWRGPVSPVLEQGTYPLRHGDMGRLDLFLVPIGSDPDGMSYEAVFS